MSDIRWLSITDISGAIGFSLSIISNSILLFLVFHNTNPIRGTYRKLLIVFSIFTMFYSFIEILLRPLIHLYDDTLYLIQRKRFDLPKGITRMIPTTYCWCYAMSFTLFAMQFLYRYIVMCKPNLVVYFSGVYFYYWLGGMLAIATSWGATALLMFPQTERTTESFLHVIRTSYDLDPYWTDYVGYKYFDTNLTTHERSVNFLSFLGVLQHGIVMDVTFGTLFYCGIKTFWKIRAHSGVSCKTRDLQLQLFRALVAQTCIPMLLMYIPIGFMFACPYFDLQLGAVTNYQTIMAQLYPGIDPFVLLFLIDSYRQRILSTICPKRIFPTTAVAPVSRIELTLTSMVKRLGNTQIYPSSTILVVNN